MLYLYYIASCIKMGHVAQYLYILVGVCIFFHSDVNVTLPSSTLQNGSLYIHLFLGPANIERLHSSKLASLSVPITRYKPPSANKFNLLTGDYEVNIHH